MKRYRLLKDLPTFEAGQLAYVSSLGNLMAGTPENPETNGRGGVQLMMYHKTTLKKFPEILTEWFEEIQEPTDSIHWKPKIGDKCFILENNNIRHTNYTGMVRDYNAYITGRVFRFEKEAIAAANRELAEVRLRRTSTLNPDPKNGNGGYVVYYDHRSNELRYCSDFFWCNIGIPIRYAGVMDAEKSIKENREDWLIYFGIKEESNDWCF